MAWKKKDKKPKSNNKKANDFSEIIANKAFFNKNISEKLNSEIDIESKDEIND